MIQGCPKHRALRSAWVDRPAVSCVREGVVYDYMMITVPEAARRAGCNPETVRRWLRSGQLASQKAGTQYLIREEDLELLLKSDSLPTPAWLRRTLTGEPMPDVVAFLRRQRSSHRS